jgi:hypothetical protein
MPELGGIPYLKLVLGTTQAPAIDLHLVFEGGVSPFWHASAVLAAA